MSNSPSREYTEECIANEDMIDNLDDNLPFELLHDSKSESGDDDYTRRLVTEAYDPVLNSGDHSPSILIPHLVDTPFNMSSPPRKPNKLDIPNPLSQLLRMNSNDLRAMALKYIPDMNLPSMHTPMNESGVRTASKSGTTPQTPQIMEALFSGANVDMESGEVADIFKAKSDQLARRDAVQYSVVKQEEVKSIGGGPMRSIRQRRPTRRSGAEFPESVRRSGAESPESVDSSATPRTYRLKPSVERDNKWRNKRDRNNDSVRKSRMKAKDEQHKRDSEMDDLRAENQELRAENESLKETVKFLQEKVVPRNMLA